MVAAAGETEGMKPAIAAAMFGGFLILLLGSFLLMDRFGSPANVALDEPPEVLQARAQEFIREFGYADAPADSAKGFFYRGYLIDYVLHHDSSSGRWQKIREGIPSVGGYWYRQSPQDLFPERLFGDGFAGNVVTRDDPAPDISGMVSVELDTQGRLTALEAVPPQHDVAANGASKPADWSALFAAAGLDLSQFHAVAPQWSPHNFADARAAWEGSPPGRSDLTLRVEAASYQGKPVSFALVWPWTQPSRMEHAQRAQRFSIANTIDITLFLGIILGGLFIARYNLKLGRGDRRGAARLAAAVVALLLAGWFVSAHHLAEGAEIPLWFKAIGLALFDGALAWIVYVALEPFIRRRWPHILISWNRLLTGQFRDPLVARDVLVGLILGGVLALINGLAYVVPGWLGKPSPAPSYSSIVYLDTARRFVGDLLSALPNQFLQALYLFFLFFLLRLVLRKEWLAGLGFLVILSVKNGLGGDYPAILAAQTAVVCLAILLILTRFGLAALTVGLFADTILENAPLTTHLGAWYASPTWICMIPLIALGFYAYWSSLGGRKLFSESAFEA